MEVLQLLIGPCKWEPSVCQSGPLGRPRYKPSYDQRNPCPSASLSSWGEYLLYLIVTLLITDMITDLNTGNRFLKVVSGSMTYFVFDATSQPLVGCSGGVYCLVGIFHWHLKHDKKFHCQLKHDHIFHCQLKHHHKVKRDKNNVSIGASLSTMILNWREDRVVLIKYWPSK